MSGPTFDRRLTPARPDLAAAFLRGQVEAARFVEGERYRIVMASVPLRPEPRPDLGIDTELLRGEAFTVYDRDAEGWSWGQGEDGYVGWLPTEALGAAAPEPTHKVGVLRTFIYPGPSMRLPMLAALPYAARLSVASIQGDFARVPDGFVWAAHLRPTDVMESDPVATAERFLGVPYLWGGRSSLGLDCSALVQTAMASVGLACPRDTDMQERELGTPIEVADLRRGDIVFWRGHVGLMQDAETLIHANGWSMTVMSEPLAVARARILAATGGDITGFRRVR